MRIKTFCIAFAAAMQSASEHTKKAYAMAYERYVGTVAMAAANPGSAGPPSTGRKLGQDAQWLTEIAKGIAVSFACRHRECRWYGLNQRMDR